MTLARLAERAFGTPLLIHPGKASVIINSVLLPKLRGEPLPQAPEREPEVRAVRRSSLAVLPIHGTLVHRTGGMDAMSGLLSYARISDMLQSALGDPSIEGILLDVDSCGGEVNGLEELVAQLRAAAKPVYASIDGSAYSAAYWLASAAQQVFLTVSSGTGSIGVIVTHIDQSGADAMAGEVYTHIFAGSHKADLSPHRPISDEARSTLQASVDKTYERFVAAVAEHRGLSAEKVRATEAATLDADEAVRLGLADRIGTLDDAAAALARRIAGSRAGAARSGAQAIAPKGKKMSDDALKGAPDEGDAANRADIERLRAEHAAALEKARAEAAEQERTRLAAYTAEVKELCAIAGQPARALDFLAAAVPVADVRKALIDARAASPSEQISGQHAPAPSDAATAANWDRIFQREAAHRFGAPGR